MNWNEAASRLNSQDWVDPGKGSPILHKSKSILSTAIDLREDDEWVLLRQQFEKWKTENEWGIDGADDIRIVLSVYNVFLFTTKRRPK